MNSGSRRKLEELVTLYELEPELSEVITEGRVDAAIIRWFLRRIGSDASVYCITDRIDVPAKEVRRRDLNVGSKGRVIAAALKIQEDSTSAADRVSFVYDIDDDIVASRSMPSVACLLHTDYTSMEMYCFAHEPLDKLLKVTLRAPDGIEAVAILEAISDVLVDVFFARLILGQLPQPVAMEKAIEKSCKLRDNVLTCNIRELISKSIGNAGGARALGIDVDALMTQIELAKKSCPADIRLAIRGHDFMQICCYYLKTVHPALFRGDRISYKTVGVFEGALITCLEGEDLMLHDLFKNLATRHIKKLNEVAGN